MKNTDWGITNQEFKIIPKIADMGMWINAGRMPGIC